MSSKRAIVVLALAAILAVVSAGAAIAPEGTASNRHAAGNRLAGTWVVTVQRPAPLLPFTAHQVYTRDGSFLSYSFAGDDPPAARSTEMGSWERVEGRLYASSGSFLRFNPQTGTLVGSTRIDRSLRLSDDGQSFTMSARVRVLDVAGNVVATLFPRGTAARMQVERIAEQP
jgi:hypothetical protein